MIATKRDKGFFFTGLWNILLLSILQWVVYMKSKFQSITRFLTSFQHQKNTLKQQLTYRDITNRFKHILVFKLLLFLLWRYLDHLPIFVWSFLFMSVIVHKLSGEPLKSAELSHTIDTISTFGRRVLGKTNLKETQPRSRAYSFWSWVPLNVLWQYAMKLAYGRKLMEISVLTEKFQLEGFLGT